MLLAVALISVACGGKDPTNPGVPVGTFHVKASLTSSTCGQPPNPWEFDVRLNRDGSTLYWVQNQLPVAGDVDRLARTKLDAEVQSELRKADEKRKLAACSLVRRDTLEILLATEEQKPAVDPADTHSFEGSLRYEFAPTDGSQCEDQLTAAGGGYDALPCVVTYNVAGTMTKKAE
jgi:hypothetical protein